MNAVERALAILELVVEYGEGLSNSDISRRLKIPKSSASYLLRTLESRGYLRRDPDGRYRVGFKAVGLGHAAMEFVDLRQVAHPILQQLAEETRGTAHLAVLEHGRAVYVDRAEVPGFLKINTWIGRDLDVHSTAVGKVLMASQPPVVVEEVLRQQGMAAHSPRTLTSPEAFRQELARVREQGFAVDDEENNLGVRCVAAPVYDNESHLEAAIGLSGPTSLATPERLPRLAQAVRQAALAVSRQLGYEPRRS